MLNPILQQLNQSKINQIMMPLKNVMSQVRAAQDPKTFLSNIIYQNPNAKQALDYINQNGGDPKAAFYKLAQDNGLDPDTIIKSLLG